MDLRFPGQWLSRTCDDPKVILALNNVGKAIGAAWRGAVFCASPSLPDEMCLQVSSVRCAWFGSSGSSSASAWAQGLMASNISSDQ